MRIHCWALIAIMLLIGNACSRTEPKPSAPELLRTATIKDIMDSMVDPSGDFMFESVQEISDEHGYRRRLQDAAALARKAADVKDKDALLKAIDGIDKACENCHLHYWYPNDKRAQEAARENGLDVN